MQISILSAFNLSKSIQLTLFLVEFITFVIRHITFVIRHIIKVNIRITSGPHIKMQTRDFQKLVSYLKKCCRHYINIYYVYFCKIMNNHSTVGYP